MARFTIYGNNPVFEALSQGVEVERLHVADDQRNATRTRDLLAMATARSIDVRYHSRRSLSFISGNRKQDQGIAADVVAPGLTTLDEFCDDPPDDFVIVALDGLDNPQNLGMAVRSIHAAGAIGLIALGKARLHPLAIKASAGVLLNARLVNCDNLASAIERLRTIGTTVFVMDASGEGDLFAHRSPARAVYVIGNETQGVTPAVRALADSRLAIPLHGDVESLNAAVTASLVAFLAARPI